MWHIGVTFGGCGFVARLWYIARLGIFVVEPDDTAREGCCMIGETYG
jgi:hypothetical protein